MGGSKIMSLDFYIKEIKFVDPMKYLGKSILIQLKGDAKPFLFKVMGITSLNNGIRLAGYDAEGLNLSIDTEDIEHIIGG
jgi:hypothetical protein